MVLVCFVVIAFGACKESYVELWHFFFIDLHSNVHVNDDVTRILVMLDFSVYCILVTSPRL